MIGSPPQAGADVFGRVRDGASFSPVEAIAQLAGVVKGVLFEIHGVKSDSRALKLSIIKSFHQSEFEC